MNKNFLSKKSWHTGSLKNIERVWLTEQRHTDEQKKIDALKKEIAEEQQILDLKKLHQDSSGKSKTERLDWMYEGSFGTKPKDSTEDYLLGKKFEDKEPSDVKQLNKTPGSLFMGAINPAQDAAAKVRDDPLLAIKKEEQKALISIIHNPMKMRMIEKEKEAQKLLKKLKKQEKKAMKKKNHQSSRSPSPESSSKRRKYDNSSNDRGDREVDVHKSSKEGRWDKTDVDMRRDRSTRSGDSNEYDRRDNESRAKERTRGDDKARRDDSREDHRNGNGNGSSYNGSRYNNNNNNNQQPSWRRDRRRGPMDDVEKEKRLKEMMANADAHEETRWTRIKIDKEQEERENKAINDREKKTFIDDVNKEVYDAPNVSVEERLRKNKHFIQRRAVDDKFL